MKKMLFFCFLIASGYVAVFNLQGAAAGRAVGRDINDLMKWKVSRGFGTKMPELASDGTLDLSNKGLVSLNGIEKIQPKERWKVRKLVLDRNNLYELHPATINLFPNLEGIYLGDNRINRIYPGTFTGLDRVRTLDLHGNMIESLDSTVFSGLRGLYHLNLGRNPLEHYEQGAFAELPDLRTLNLDETFLSEFSLEEFSDNNPRLEHIYINNVSLTENMRKKIARTKPGFIVTGDEEPNQLYDYYSDEDEDDEESNDDDE